MCRNWHEVLVIVALGSLCACPHRSQKGEPPEPPHHVLATEAQVFAEALGSQDAHALNPWFRPGQTITIRRHCPDCAVQSRVRASTIQKESALWELAGSLQRQTAPTNSNTSKFDFGTTTCEKFCCKYATGLLDHATTYLLKACFIRDTNGLALSALELLDA